MAKVGKKYAAAKQQIEPRPYTVEDAMGVLKKVHFAKFNETIEVLKTVALLICKLDLSNQAVVIHRV